MGTLGPFSHILVPAGKAGKIYFAKDVAPYFDTADFSRLNIGATSGATVFRNGQLIELAENEPDWDDKDGCPVIKMRPQALNVLDNPSNFTTSSWSKVAVNTALAPVITLNAGLAPDGTNTAQRVVFDVSAAFNDRSLLRQGTSAFTTNGKFTFWGKSFNGTTQYINGATGSTLGSFTLTNEWQKFEFDAGAPGAAVWGWELRNGQSVENTADVLLWMPDLRDFNYTDSTIINYGATPLTRSSNQIVDTPISKGLLTASAGSFALKIKVNSDIRTSSTTRNFMLGNNNIAIDAVNGFDMLTFGGSSTIRFGIYTEGTRRGDFSLSAGIVSIIATWGPSGWRIHRSTGAAISGSEALTLDLDYLIFSGSAKSYDILSLGFAPITLTEAQAIEELNKL